MQQTIQLGQVQPSVLSQVKAVVKSLKTKVDNKVNESEFCQVLGITPWHYSLQGIAVTAAVFVLILMVCGFAEWLNGSAL
jgi:hypothetical protein